VGLGDTIGSVIIKFVSNTVDFDKGLEKMSSGSKALVSNLNNVASAAGDFGRQMTGLAAVISAPLIGGVKSMMDFDAAFHEVLSIITTPMSNTAIDQLRAGVLDLSKTMGIDAVEATRGLYQAISSGIPADNVLDFMKTAAIAAKAGTTDLFTSVDALTTVVNSYGAEVMSAEKASDLLFTAVQFGKVEFDDLAQGIGQVAALAAQAKLPFDEVAGILAAMTQSGLVPAEAITALKGAIVSILSPSDQAAKAAKEMGVEWNASALESKGLVAMLEDLRVKTGGSAEKIAMIVPEIRAMNGVMVAGAQNGKVLADAMTAVGNGTGASMRAFEEMEKSVKASWDKIKANIKVAAIEIGDALRDDVEVALDKVLVKLREFSAWIDKNPAEFKEMVSTWKDWAIAIGAVGIASLVLERVIKFGTAIITLFGGGAKAVKFLYAALSSPAAYNAVMLLGAGIEKVAFAIGALGATTVATFAAIGVGAVVIANEARKTGNAQEEMTKSTEKTYTAAQEAAKKFGVENSKMLVKYADDVKNATNEQDKLVKMQMYANETANIISADRRAKEAELQAEMMKTVEAIGQQENALHLTDAAWLIHKETGVSATQAVMMANKELAGAVDISRDAAAKAAQSAIENYEKMTDADKKYLEQTLNTQMEREKFAQMDVKQQEEFVAMHLKANNFVNASTAERAEIMLNYRNKEISIDQAVLAVKQDFTDKEIALLELGMNAADIAAQRKEQSGKDDTAALAEKLGQDAQLMDKFVADTQKRIDQLIQQRESLKAAQAAAAEEGDVSGYLNYSQQVEAANHAIIASQQELDRVRTQAHANLVTNYAEEMGIDFERAQASMEANEIEAAALAQRKERLGENFAAVTDSLGQYKKIYEQLNADQKLAIDGLIANVLEAGIAVNGTQQGIANAQVQATEAARNSLAAMSNEATSANSNFQLSLTNSANVAGEITPKIAESLKVVNAAYIENQQFIAATNKEIEYQSQAIKSLTAAGGDHTAEIAQRQAKIVELTGSLKEASEGTDMMTVSMSGNRTAMVEATQVLSAQIQEVEKEIMARRQAGESTTEQQARLRILNAEYDLTTQKLESVGLGSQAAKIGIESTGTAAGGAAGEVGKMGTAAGEAATNVGKLATTTEQLPAAAERGLSQTKGKWDGFFNWMYTELGLLGKAIKYVLDPSQTGSPSMNQYIAIGLMETEKVYKSRLTSLSGSLDDFRSRHALAFSQMGEDVPGIGTRGGGGSMQASAKAAPQKQNTLKTTTTNLGAGGYVDANGNLVVNTNFEQTTEYKKLGNAADSVAQETVRVSRSLRKFSRDMEDSLLSSVWSGGLRSSSGIGGGIADGRSRFDIPPMTQDSLADKIGKAVAEAMVPTNTTGLALNVNYHKPPVVEEERAGTSRLGPREESSRYRRRYY